MPLKLRDGKLVLKVQIDKIEALKPKVVQTFGTVTADTEFNCRVSAKSQNKIRLKDLESEVKQLFKANFSFQECGIGGLDSEFQEIFRRAFNSRRFPASIVEKYGVKHVKGMLLYGPPGTGKTLIARQIAKALNCKQVKKISGPEIFDKFVGGSEAKIRELFADAEAD